MMVATLPSLESLILQCVFWNRARNSINVARFVLCKEAKHGGVDS